MRRVALKESRCTYRPIKVINHVKKILAIICRCLLDNAIFIA